MRRKCLRSEYILSRLSDERSSFGGAIVKGDLPATAKCPLGCGSLIRATPHLRYNGNGRQSKTETTRNSMRKAGRYHLNAHHPSRSPRDVSLLLDDMHIEEVHVSMKSEAPTRYRILDFLRRINGSNEDDLMAPVSACQQGIAAELGFTSGRVSSTLTRADKIGLVSRTLRHVPGRQRRMKTYRLTEKGYGWLLEYERSKG